MTCTHDLIVLSKTIEMIRYCESHAYSGKNALNTVTNDLTQVSVPAKDQTCPYGVQHFHVHSFP
jgi:hypothetical protein